MAVRLVWFGFWCAVVFSLQALLAARTRLAPEIAPALAVYAGLFAPRGRVALAAGLVGLLRAANGPEPTGALLLLALAVAGFASHVRELVYRERALAQFLVAFLGGAVHLLVVLLLGVVVPLGGTRGVAGVAQRALSVLLGALVAPLVFTALRLARARP